MAKSYHHFVPTSKGWVDDRYKNLINLPLIGWNYKPMNWDDIPHSLHEAIHFMYWNDSPIDKIFELINSSKWLPDVKKEDLIHLLYSPLHKKDFYKEWVISDPGLLYTPRIGHSRKTKKLRHANKILFWDTRYTENKIRKILDIEGSVIKPYYRDRILDLVW